MAVADRDDRGASAPDTKAASSRSAGRDEARGGDVLVVELQSVWIKLAAGLMLAALFKASKLMILDRPSEFDWFRAGFSLVSAILAAIVLFRERRHHFELDRWEVREYRGDQIVRRGPLKLLLAVKRGWTGVRADFAGGLRIRMARGWTGLEDAAEHLERELDGRRHQRSKAAR